MRRVTILLLAAILTANAQTGDAGRLLKAARNLELVDGDLNGAIKQYTAIGAKYAKSDRASAAMALIYLAECYQKKGDAEAHRTFERVIRDFSDQRDAVALARARLGTSEARRTGIVTRQVWTGPKVDLLGSISPDGRYLSFVDWLNGGDLAVRE